MTYETRHTSIRAREGLEEDRRRAARRYALETIIVLLVFAAALAFIIARTIVAANREPLGPGPGESVLMMAVVFALEVVCGGAALMLGAKFWLDGVGPLGGTMLRLLALVAVLHVIATLMGGVPIYGLIVVFAVGSGVAAWIFRFDIVEAALTVGVAMVLTIVGLILLSALVDF